MQLPSVETRSDEGFGDPVYVPTVSIISLHPFLAVAVTYQCIEDATFFI